MIRLKLPFVLGGNSHSVYSTFISKEEYTRIMRYARQRDIKLEGFKKFSGDIHVIEEMVDDILAISKDFPRILTSRKSIVISNDIDSYEDDFATTIDHIIYINSHIYNNTEYLKNEYNVVAQKGHFVKDTTYRSIIRHEVGHVVSNMYRIDPMMVAKNILPDKTNPEIIEYVKHTLSLYAADFPDGREFISECFSSYYSGVDNEFAQKYVDYCIKLAKEAEIYDKK